MSLAKKDLSQKLKQVLNLKMETTDLVVEEVCQSIKKSLRESKTVKLSGFWVSSKQNLGLEETQKPWRLFQLYPVIK